MYLLHRKLYTRNKSQIEDLEYPKSFHKPRILQLFLISELLFIFYQSQVSLITTLRFFMQIHIFQNTINKQNLDRKLFYPLSVTESTIL